MGKSGGIKLRKCYFCNITGRNYSHFNENIITYKYRGVYAQYEDGCFNPIELQKPRRIRGDGKWSFSKSQWKTVPQGRALPPTGPCSTCNKERVLCAKTKERVGGCWFSNCRKNRHHGIIKCPKCHDQQFEPQGPLPFNKQHPEGKIFAHYRREPTIPSSLRGKHTIYR